MIKINAVSKYTRISSLFNNDYIIKDFKNRIIGSLINPSFSNMSDANVILSEATGFSLGVVLLIDEELESLYKILDTAVTSIYKNELKLKISKITKLLNNIIRQSINQAEAESIIDLILIRYKNDIINNYFNKINDDNLILSKLMD